MKERKIVVSANKLCNCNVQGLLNIANDYNEIKTRLMKKNLITYSQQEFL